jgi:MFS family permease
VSEEDSWQRWPAGLVRLTADDTDDGGAGLAAERNRLFADIRPLRESGEYRRLWTGQSLSALGNQMTNVAVPVQVYAMTHSSFAVGAIGLAVAVPLIAVGLVGGSLADAVDRRKLVLLTSSGLALLSLVFALQAALNLRQLWLLYVVIALQGCLFAIDQPARTTFVPRLLPPGRIQAANALNQLSFQLSGTLGPLLAGVVIATAGLKAAYATDAATFTIAIYAVARLRPMPPQGGGATPGFAAVAEGLRWAKAHRVIAMVFLVDLNAMIFGMPRALFPALAATHFGGGARTVGLLYAAPAIGGLIGAAFSGPVARVRRQGLAVLVSVAIWGGSIAGFSVSRSLWLGVVLLAIAGGSDMVSAIFRSTMLLQNVPDALLGRLSAVNFVVIAGGPRVGDLEAGSVASLTSPVFSAVSGGLACVVGVVLLGLAVPAFARYRVGPDGTPPPAAAELPPPVGAS